MARATDHPTLSHMKSSYCYHKFMVCIKSSFDLQDSSMLLIRQELKLLVPGSHPWPASCLPRVVTTSWVF